MDWRFSTYLLFLAAIMIGIPWATSDAGLCGLKIAVKAMSGEDATTCFEFWLNRYQSLISALISLIAASVAAALVWRQIRSAQDANSISRVAQSAVQFDAIYKRLDAVRELKDFSSIPQFVAQELDYMGEVASQRQLKTYFETGRDKIIDKYWERVSLKHIQISLDLSAGFEAPKEVKKIEACCFRAIDERNYFISLSGKEHFPERRRTMINNFASVSSDLMQASFSFFDWCVAEENRLLSLLKSLDDRLVR